MPDLEVCVAAIRDDATLWDEQAGVATTVANSAEGLRLGLVDAGIFLTIIDSNNQVCDSVRDWCNGANTEMTNIADALRENARAYEENEQDITQSVKDAY